MPDGAAIKRQAMLIGTLAALFLVAELAAGAVSLYTDWLWFDSLGYQSIFVTVLQAKVLAFLAGAVVYLVPAMASLFIARAVMSKHRTVSIREESGVAYIVQLGQDMPRRIVFFLAALAAVGMSVLMGFSVAGQWETFLKFLNERSFGIADPLFQQDVGFYFFSMPVFRFLQGWLFGVLGTILLLTAAVYLISVYQGQIGIDPGVLSAHRPAKLHVMVLAAMMALVLAVSYRIQLYDLVFSAHGVVSGAGYTDASARQMALWVLMGIMVITALLFLLSGFRQGFSLPIWGVGLWVAAAVLLGNIYPLVVQKLQVEPSELQRERPYIEASIKMTRQAFGLDRVQEQDFNAADSVSMEEVKGNPDTISNIRLWDHGPLKDTYNQIQAIRLYYDFHDVDIDRYTLDGKYRQVMVAARELSPDKLAAQAQNWVTRRLQFTHGYGLAMSPVNEIVGEGLPNLLVKDIPPQGELKIDRPQIYYGEVNNGYVIVKTTAQEFDYAKGDENVYGSFEGDGGVQLDSLFRRLLYAWYFRDGNIIFSGYLTPESRVLYYRDIQQRVQKIAPFLMLDSDPYLVAADGQLYWIQDAYTYGDDYPYSAMYQERIQVTAPARPGAAATQQVRIGNQFNYIRNSAKVVVNAYDGSVRFYLADPNDPLAQSYSAIFPALFSPLDQMPASLKAHVRYPEDLFKSQSEMYRTFHMQDPQVFYNREDLWSVPNESVGDARRPLEPYYLIMRLPGEKGEEFLQLLPFSPSNKDNMIAWLAARSDVESYGKLIVYKYPKDKLIYGPMQVEARINQDPVITSQFTLWGQAGSKVTRGNLLAIPVGQANLYIEPIYLQANSGSIPELKRVIASTGNRVVMEPSLGEALNALYDGKLALTPAALPASSGGAATPSAPAQSGAPTGAAAGLSEVARSAQEHYNRAQDRLKAGDWAGFGEELKKLEADLKALNSLGQ